MPRFPVEQEGSEPGAAGALVVLAEGISDVERFRRRDAEPRAGAQEDLRLRLAGLLDRGDGDGPEAAREPEPFQKGRKLRVPVRDDREEKPAPLERVERFRDVRIDHP